MLFFPQKLSVKGQGVGFWEYLFLITINWKLNAQVSVSIGIFVNM